MNIYLLCILLMLVGLYGVTIKKHLIKKIIGFVIMEYAICLLIAGFGSVNRHVNQQLQTLIVAIIISGIASTLIFLALALRIYEKHGTFDTSKIRGLRG